MKKTRLFMVILALLMLCTMLALTSCGDEDSGVVVDPNATSVPLQTSAYFFKSGDAKITLFMTMSDLKSALGVRVYNHAAVFIAACDGFTIFITILERFGKLV